MAKFVIRNKLFGIIIFYEKTLYAFKNYVHFMVKVKLRSSIRRIIEVENYSGKGYNF